MFQAQSRACVCPGPRRARLCRAAGDWTLGVGILGIAIPGWENDLPRDGLRPLTASAEILRTLAFVANVQSTQRIRCNHISHSSIALSLRERVGVRGCCHRTWSFELPCFNDTASRSFGCRMRTSLATLMERGSILST